MNYILNELLLVIIPEKKFTFDNLLDRKHLQ